MQKNWYAVYTKPHCEKKVSLLLSKKGIENFYPVNYHKSHSFLYTKILHEPLFKSYVFVKTTRHDIINLSKKTDCILSLLYFMNEPAIIDGDEINEIKEFSKNHREIKLEKLYINLKGVQDSSDAVTYRMDGKNLIIKNRVIKVNLPSIGYTMVAKTEDENIMGKEIFFSNKEFLVQS